MLHQRVGVTPVKLNLQWKSSFHLYECFYQVFPAEKESRDVMLGSWRNICEVGVTYVKSLCIIVFGSERFLLVFSAICEK